MQPGRDASQADCLVTKDGIDSWTRFVRVNLSLTFQESILTYHNLSQLHHFLVQTFFFFIHPVHRCDKSGAAQRTSDSYRCFRATCRNMPPNVERLGRWMGGKSGRTVGPEISCLEHTFVHLWVGLTWMKFFNLNFGKLGRGEKQWFEAAATPISTKLPFFKYVHYSNTGRMAKAHQVTEDRPKVFAQVCLEKVSPTETLLMLPCQSQAEHFFRWRRWQNKKAHIPKRHGKMVKIHARNVPNFKTFKYARIDF